MNTDNPLTGSARSTDPLGADPAIEETRHAVDEVAAEAKNIAREAQAKMAQIAGDTTEQAKSFAEANKGKVATQITAFAGALNKAAEELERSDQAMVAGYAKDVARGIENMSTALRERGVDDLMASVQQFARTQPAAFLGVAALAGFAASRFAKASTSRPSQSAMKTGTGTESLAASSPAYPDGDRGEQHAQGLGSSSDAAAWRSTGNYPQTERGH